MTVAALAWAPGVVMNPAFATPLLGGRGALCPRMSAPARWARSVTTPDYIFPDSPSHSLHMFETMLRVKPYPAACPFEDSFFEPPGELPLQAAPSPTELAALHRLHTRLELSKAESVLEVVCDGRSHIKTRRSVTQLHVSQPSYRTGRRISPRLRHAVLHTPAESAALQLPWESEKFDRIVCHGCVPYVARPLSLFAELSRVLAPSGTLSVSWADTTVWEDSKAGAAALAAPRASAEDAHATRGWADVDDSAERMYMTASFFRYSSDWARLAAAELRLDRGADVGGRRAVFALSGTKLSKRAMLVARSREDVQRARSVANDPPPAAAPPAAAARAAAAPAAPAAEMPATANAAETAARAAEALHDAPGAAPSAAPPAVVRVGAAGRSLQQLAEERRTRQQRRQSERSRRAVEAAAPTTASDATAAAAAAAAAAADAAPSTAAAPSAPAAAPPPPLSHKRDAAARIAALSTATRAEEGGARKGEGREEGAGGEEGEGGEGGEGASKLVRDKILETIKRGIDQSSNRTLSDGEQKMLDHMKTYILETKVAESNLSEQERQIWEDMKNSYVSSAAIRPPTPSDE